MLLSRVSSLAAGLGGQGDARLTGSYPFPCAATENVPRELGRTALVSSRAFRNNARWEGSGLQEGVQNSRHGRPGKAKARQQRPPNARILLDAARQDAAFARDGVMEQMLLILAVALLIWGAAGIGRAPDAAEREVFAGHDDFRREKPSRREST
jgi:hypothetical protein